MTDDVTKQIIETHIKARIVAALEQDAGAFIEKLVAAALSKPVNEWGGEPQYSETKMPYIDWLVGTEIRSAAQHALQRMMIDRREEIEAAVVKAMPAHKIAQALLGQLDVQLGGYVKLQFGKVDD